jgi:hypothetical protein
MANNPRVYFDMKAGDENLGRLVIEVRQRQNRRNYIIRPRAAPTGPPSMDGNWYPPGIFPTTYL